jgi:hypothetical protein
MRARSRICGTPKACGDRSLKSTEYPKVYKKDLRERFPFSKEFLAQFSQQHPQVLEIYKTLKGADSYCHLEIEKP